MQIDPSLTVAASKHLAFVKELNRRSRPSEQEMKDIATHAAKLKEAVDGILKEVNGDRS